MVSPSQLPAASVYRRGAGGNVLDATVHRTGRVAVTVRKSPQPGRMTEATALLDLAEARAWHAALGRVIAAAAGYVPDNPAPARAHTGLDGLLPAQPPPPDAPLRRQLKNACAQAYLFIDTEFRTAIIETFSKTARGERSDAGKRWYAHTKGVAERLIGVNAGDAPAGEMIEAARLAYNWLAENVWRLKRYPQLEPLKWQWEKVNALLHDALEAAARQMENAP